MKTVKIIAIVVAIIGIAYFSLPKYAQRALIYQKVGIEDYTIFANREVKTGTPQKWELDSVYNSVTLPDSIITQFEELQTVAYLVIKDGKIVYEKYWEDYGTVSYSNSFSMAKSIIGLLIGAAIDDGYIKNLEQPVSDFVPEYRNKTNKNLTIKDVLTMSSGLNWDESYGSLFSTTTDAYYGTDLNSLIYSLKVVEEPGKRFKYLSGNPQLLAMVIKNATGKSVSEYTSEKFWKPMGAIHDALWCLDKEGGVEKAYCCFNSNARDFARWGQLILNNGTWNRDTLISPEYIKELITPASYLTDETGNSINYYGYQWWIQHMDGVEIPYMRGILGQYVFVLPQYNAVVVRLGHKRSKQYKEHHPLDTYLYLNSAKYLLNKIDK